MGGGGGGGVGVGVGVAVGVGVGVGDWVGVGVGNGDGLSVGCRVAWCGWGAGGLGVWVGVWRSQWRPHRKVDSAINITTSTGSGFWPRRRVLIVEFQSVVIVHHLMGAQTLAKQITIGVDLSTH